MEPMITTIDNPFNPITQFEEWNRWDIDKGYNTLSYMARTYISAPSLSLSEDYHAYMTALSEIVEMNPTLYRIVKPDAA